MLPEVLTLLISLISLVVNILLIFAIFRLFHISKTADKILAAIQLADKNRREEYNMIAEILTSAD